MTTPDVFDVFIHESGSKQWPSDDPNDSPFDKFTCKICGEVIVVRMYGAFSQGLPDSEKELRQHLLVKHLLKKVGI